MKLTKKLQEEVIKVYDAWLNSYLNGDVKTYDKYLDEAYHFIGSTDNEEFLNRKATTRFFKATADQLAGKTDLKNRSRTIEYFEGLVFITELFDAWVLMGNTWTYYGRFRFTSALRQNKEGWRFIYQHFSMPDSKAQKGETLGAEKVSKENQELRDAIKRRTAELEIKNRELEIETSLEKVRAQAMSMHQPDDMLVVCKILYNELKSLGFHELRNAMIHLFPDEDYFINYDYSVTAGSQIVQIPCSGNRAMEKFIKEIRKSADAFQHLIIKGKALKDWIAFRKANNETDDHRLEKINSLNYYNYALGPAGIGISTYSPISEEKQELLQRFRNVFQLAYQRYSDISFAQAQAKEARIDTALERVRAAAMAMHKPNDLSGISKTIFTELKSLDYSQIRNTEIVITHDEKKSVTTYHYSDYGKHEVIQIDYASNPILQKWVKDIKKANDAFVPVTIPEKQMKEWNKYRKELGYKNDPGMRRAKTVYYYSYSMGLGALSVSSWQSLTDDQIQILERFRNVFNLAYQRYADIAKAEAQTREARIEVALEKIRNQSMLMQHSREVQDLSKIFHEQLVELNIPTEFSYIWLPDQSKEEHMFWATWTETAAGKKVTNSKSIIYPLDRKEPYTAACFKAWKSKTPVHIHKIPAKETPRFFETWKELLKGAKKLKARYFPNGLYYAESYMKYGCFGINIRRTLIEEEQDILFRFTIEFERAYTRFLDLQKAEAQAREAEIELALERVRARTMAMQHSDELAEASFLLDQQVRALGIKTWGCAFNIFREKDSIEWFGNEKGVLPTYTIPRKGIFKKYYDFGQKGNSIYVQEISGKKCIAHYEYMSTLPVIGDVLRQLKKTNGSFPDYQIDHVVYFKYGYLLFITVEPVPEAHTIFKRFAKVFEQTYTRFLDLQKAEAQAREAEIELGLERVRARAMAMNHSDELSELVDTVFKELTKLNFELKWCIINIIDEPSLTNMVWAANPETNKPPESYLMKFEDYPFHHSMMKGYQQRKTKHVYVLEGKEKKTYDEYLFNKTEWRRVPKKAQVASRAMKRYVATFTFSNFGGLQTVGEEPLSEENLDILSRFGKVFDLTYTRFEDLQKAEAQAREAQIEAALERVRSRSMAMQESSEIAEVLGKIFAELTSLDVELDRCIIWIVDPETESAQAWIASSDVPEGSEHYFFPYSTHPYYKKFIKAWRSRESLFELEIKGRLKQSWDQYLFEESEFKNLPKKAKSAMQSPGKMFTTTTCNQYGLICAAGTRPPSEQSKSIFRRFGRVFEQSYTRFEDIKQAEAQAREAEVELALERVRSQAMAMKESSELLDIVVTMRTEFIRLGHEAHYFWHMMWLPDKYEKAMTSGDGSRIGMVMELPRHIHGDVKLLADWEQSDEPLIVYPMDAEAAIAYVDKMITLGDFKQVDPNAPSHDDIRHIGGLTFVMARTTHGEIGYSLPGVVENPPQDHLEILVRFAGAFDIAHQRFLDLQKSEAQAREVEIELALEKVRSRSMGMQKSEELKEVIQVVYDQFVHLNIHIEHTGFIIDYKTRDDMHIWLADRHEVPAQVTLPYFDCAHWNSFVEAKEKGKDFFTNLLSFEEKNKFYQDLFKLIPGVPEETLEYYYSCPGLAISTVLLENVGLYIENFSGTPYTDEENNILMRFGKVFQQTYTRFLDLQKAEAQAREAKIENALEKIRSRTMAMQHSDELPEAANLLFLEVQGLGIPAWSCGYNILAEDKKSTNCIMSSEGTLQQPFILPLTGETSFIEWYDFLQSGQPFFEQELGGKGLQQHYAYMKSLPELKDIFQHIQDSGLTLPIYQINHLVKYSHGFLLFITYEKVPHAHDIFKRFTKVFEQTYTRFLDLLKAEARAREAQIEAALEKVRSRTMGMQKSDELGEVANILFKELNRLVDNLWTCGFVLCEKDRGEDEWWLSDENGFIPPFYLPNTGDVTHANIYNAWKQGKTYHTEQLEGAALQEHYDWLMDLPVARKIFEDMFATGFTLPTWQKLHCAFFKTGYLVIITQVPCPEEEIFKRFAQVFDLTYTRFLDLKKAEAQTRQAQIEVALERVRARALAMQQPEELKEVAEVLRQEMGSLGVEELETCSIYINDEQADRAECWYAIKDLRSDQKNLVNDHFPLDLNHTWVGREMLSFYNSGEKQVSIVMQGVNRVEWIRYCEANSAPFRGYYGEEIPDRTYHLYKFSHGAIGAASAGDISKESWDLLKRAASVFSLAYSRFKDLTQARIDLQRLKEEKQRAENALLNLQAAQKQLIQSEKMASLGELTAGIAHEIKNPLNFVNNFSEVSAELLEEMNEELSKGEIDEARLLVKDIKQNLEKILTHGRRADSIVKGMLQHSRSSGGVKEPTDLNALCDEYLRLAYHGLRAKDKSFNATMKTDFDQDVGIINIIPQDIGRVILNLLTNAFYAVDEKKQNPGSLKGQHKPSVDNSSNKALAKLKTAADTKYEPTVSLSTKRAGKQVEIRVTDNGNGIPEAAKEKIFQPFFTTKPTGQGTGLGLSMSYDIVTKGHEGALKVESTSAKGTTFTISLPVSNSR